MSLSYSDAIEFLYGLQLFGAKFGLASPAQLAAAAGHPQGRLRFIHVAGTNGKGSTCAILESIYRAAGLRVGLFTSPHLITFCERIQINRQPITEPQVVVLVERLQVLLKSFPPSDHPTFFEVVTIMALLHFAQEACDVVIWETGMGGRLDATNIVTPLAAVLTTIELDHEKWLGATLEEIAFEKAGIIKPRVPVIAAASAPTVVDVLTRVASAQSAPLTLVDDSQAAALASSGLVASLLGNHQRLNSALAVTVVRVLGDQLTVRTEALRAGLANVIWAGRLQLIRTRPDQELLLDGAHNPSGARTLRQALEQHFPRKRTLIVGLLKDKDYAGICQILAPLADRIFAVRVDSDRSATPEEVAVLCRQAHPGAEVVACPSFAAAWALATADPFVVATGSLHFLGEVMEVLRLSPLDPPGERGLNEWGSEKMR